MKHAVAASSLLAIAAASPQFGGGNHGPQNGGGDSNHGPGGNGGAWSGAPSCVSDIWGDLRNGDNNANDWSSYCTGDALNDLNSRVADSDCDDSDKEAVYQVIAQACANAGETPTASPQATFSATSGKPFPISGSNGGPWGGRHGDWTSKSSLWQSWTSAHPTPAVTDSAAWSSWSTAAKSDWSSWASANGVPVTALGGAGPFPFGGPGRFFQCGFPLNSALVVPLG